MTTGLGRIYKPNERDAVTTIYGLTNEFGQIFYVGKTTSPEKRCKEHSKSNHGFQLCGMAILEHVSRGSDDNAAERKWISYFGRANLVNKTNGGNGAWSTSVSDETKRKLSEHMKKQRRENPAYHRPLTEEERKRLSDSHRGKKLSEEAKRKVGAFWKGRSFSQEQKDRIRAAAVAMWSDIDFAQRQRDAVKMKWEDPEYRAKQAEAWSRRKRKE